LLSQQAIASVVVGWPAHIGVCRTDPLRACEKIDDRISANLDERATRHYTIGYLK
jgi:hypothetical protein